MLIVAVDTFDVEVSLLRFLEDMRYDPILYISF